MKRFIQRHQQKFSLALLLLILLAIPLAWALRDAIYALLVTPVAYRFWVLDQVARSLPQASYWNFLLLLAVFNIVYVLVKIWRVTLTEPAEPGPSGRLAEWLESLQKADQGGFIGENLRRELRLLFVQTLAHRQQLPLREAWRQLRSGSLPISPELNAYLRGEDNDNAGSQPAGPSPILAKRPTSPSNPPIPSEITGIIQLLEQYLSNKIEDEQQAS